MALNDYKIKYFENLRRCQKCVLPESFPGITFDQKRV